MQKLVQKAVFAALLVSSSAFANGDLLLQATDGAVTTAKAEVVALSDGEMRDVKGGFTYQNRTYSGLTRQYGGYIVTNTGVWNRGVGNGYSNLIKKSY